MYWKLNNEEQSKLISEILLFMMVAQKIDESQSLIRQEVKNIFIIVLLFPFHHNCF